jgi:hypothetical protein
LVLTLIKIRFLQAARAIHGIGIGRIVFLFLLFSFLGYVSLKAAEQYPVWLSAICFGIILMIHFQRTDYKFLQKAIYSPFILFVMEYTILSLPVISLLLLFQKFEVTYLLLASILSLSFLKPITLKSRNLNLLPPLLPKSAFEWKSGLRRSEIYIIILYLIGIATSFHEAGVPIIIFLMSIFPLNYFEKGEPLHILFAPEKNASSLIICKIKTTLKYYLLPLLPLLVLYSLFHIEYWYIPVIETTIFSVVLVYMIVLKYAFYLPNEKNAAAQTFLSIGVLGIFIPVFIPLMLFLIIYFYQKALKNLNPYLDDYNT